MAPAQENLSSSCS